MRNKKLHTSQPQAACAVMQQIKAKPEALGTNECRKAATNAQASMKCNGTRTNPKVPSRNWLGLEP